MIYLPKKRIHKASFGSTIEKPAQIIHQKIKKIVEVANANPGNVKNQAIVIMAGMIISCENNMRNPLITFPLNNISFVFMMIYI